LVEADREIWKPPPGTAPIPVLLSQRSQRRDHVSCDGGDTYGGAGHCSQHPPRWYVGISKLNHTFDVATTTHVAVVHAFGADNIELARLFG
jgi:hypothetical protein